MAKRQGTVEFLRELADTFAGIAKPEYQDSGCDVGELFAGDELRTARKLRLAAKLLERSEPAAARTHEWAVQNCHMLARREIRRLDSWRKSGGDTTPVGMAITAWEHVKRICEEAGIEGGGILRSEPAAASAPLLIDQLADRLEDWAQNEEMIDQFFLGHGKDCNEAAKLLRALSSAPGERT